MIFAALGDVNGNLRAVEAALSDLDEAGILTIVQTGNVAGAPGGDGAARLLRERGVTVAQGLRDRQAARFQRSAALLRRKLGEAEWESIRRAHQGLSREILEWFARLPHAVMVSIDGFTIVVCHGAPSGVSRVLDQATPEERLRREREAAPADVIVCGGSETPFSRMVDGTLFVGPGPLGPRPGEACYTVVDLETRPWRARPRVIPVPAAVQ